MAPNYKNFVKPVSVTNSEEFGKEAKKIYLEEIKSENQTVVPKSTDTQNPKSAEQLQKKEISDKEIFLAVQNNDVQTLTAVLNSFPDKIDLVDSFGWSLLMIACQANAKSIVKELLKRGVNISVRDKAGNSAQSLVIVNKNLDLAELLLKQTNKVTVPDSSEFGKVKLKSQYKCEVCLGNIFPDRNEHLVSTIHNINASKGKKMLPNFVIPESNKGYQIMLKVGWDKESGLGPFGSGTKYPIKAKMKKDKKGLGHKETSVKESVKSIKQTNKNVLLRKHEINRRQEINFRREFY